MPDRRSRRIPREMRQTILDELALGDIHWSGRLDEPAFLARVWPTDELPSSDSRFSNAAGDVWQHRVNNPQDWEDDWLFGDSRFDLAGCDDDTFERFLIQTVHPSVRSDPDEAERLVRFYNEVLAGCGRQLTPRTTQPRLAGGSRVVYEFRGVRAAEPIRLESTQRIGDPGVLQDHLRRIDANVDADPSAAIGSSKELIESVCKVILDDYGTEYGGTDGINDLYRKVASALALRAESVPESARGSDAARLALRGLVTTVQALAELRNELGLGHGRTTRSPALARHARLAASSAGAVAEFLLATWHARRLAEQ